MRKLTYYTHPSLRCCWLSQVRLEGTVPARITLICGGAEAREPTVVPWGTRGTSGVVSLTGVVVEGAPGAGVLGVGLSACQAVEARRAGFVSIGCAVCCAVISSRARCTGGLVCLVLQIMNKYNQFKNISQL